MKARRKSSLYSCIKKDDLHRRLMEYRGRGGPGGARLPASEAGIVRSAFSRHLGSVPAISGPLTKRRACATLNTSYGGVVGRRRCWRLQLSQQSWTEAASVLAQLETTRPVRGLFGALPQVCFYILRKAAHTRVCLKTSKNRLFVQ